MKHTLRPPLVLGALVLSVVAFRLAGELAVTRWWAGFGLVAPDLVFLGGLGARPAAPGLMPRQLVRPYNTTHHPLTPVALVALVPLLGPPLGVLGLAWTAHIAWDRGVGYDLRLPDGSIRPARGVLLGATR